MIEHWFDFICPFCYIAQDRNQVLRAAGIHVNEGGYPIHPEIPSGGMPVGPRRGSMYDDLRREADAADLPLVWSDRIPYSRPALVRSQIVRRWMPTRHVSFVAAVFDAYFGHGRDIESDLVLDGCADVAEVPRDLFSTSRTVAVGEGDLDDSIRFGEENGVSGTPAWLVDGRLLTGLRSRADFQQLADAYR